MGERSDEQKVSWSRRTTPIVAYAPGDASDSKPGAQIIVANAQKQADGTLQTRRR